MDLRRRATRMLALSLAAGLSIAACGDDDNDAASTSDITTPSGGLAAFCDAAVAVAAPPGPEVDFDSATEDEIAAAARSWARDVMRPLADDVVATAPEELVDELAVLSGAVDDVAETGEVGAFETPEAASASDRFDEIVPDMCGWTRVEVTAVDYEFDGLPSELAAGATQFELTTEGGEPHELALFRKNDGVTESAEELLARPEEEAFELVSFVGSEPTFAEPGDTETTAVELQPGDYVAVCFIPVGGGEDGPPHFSEGMYAEFTVE